MSNAPTLHGDDIWQVIEGRHDEELRFRSAMITSTALHTGIALAFLLAPLLLPRPQLFQITPVNMVQLQAPEPAPAPPPVEEESAEEQAPEPEPEPADPEPPEPDEVPEDLEAQRRAEEEEAIRREEERREREAEEERQRLAEEARRQREAEEAEARRRAEEEAEARRREQTQTASRQPTPQSTPAVTQQAERGETTMLFGEPLSERDITLLDYWINRVLTNINSNWQPQVRPAGSREIVAVVHFRVDRSGRLIVGPDLRSGSGDRRYDDAAVSAVRAGQPFPPLPQAYRGSTITINLHFRQ